MMKLKKGIIIAALVTLIVLPVIIIICILYFQDVPEGFEFTVRNRTNTELQDLMITHEYSTKDSVIPKLKPGQIYRFTMILKEKFAENSMYIYYMDKQNKLHETTVVSYFEKGYGRGRVRIDIVSANENGELVIKIKHLGLLNPFSGDNTP